MTNAGLQPGSPSARSFAVMRLLQASWGVPALSAEQVGAEMAAQGFVDASLGSGPSANVLTATRP
jgi:hypothetical protein